MKKIKFISIASLFFHLLGNPAPAQEPSFEWAKNMGGYNSSGNSISVDTEGNVYLTGYFSGTGDFDPGIGTVSLSSNGGNDVFIQKLDASGNLVWVKQIEGNYGHSITVDTEGNVYLTGYFSGTGDFDPGIGTVNLSSSGDTDIFIQKLDASGNLVWVKQIGGDYSGGGSFFLGDRGNSIAVDSLGNVYVTGYFLGTGDFDPGSGTINLSSLGSSDTFVQKLDASGNLVWVKQIGGTSFDEGNSIAVDANSCVYITGSFGGVSDFDPGTETVNLSSSGLRDIFVQKLDASGNFVWVKRMGGPEFDVGCSIDIDAFGNVYTVGYFNETVDFDPGAGTLNLSSIGYSDIFVQKLNPSGNLIWAKRIGGDGNGGNSWQPGDRGKSISVDASSNIFITGYFSGIGDFDPGTGTVNLSSSGDTDIFIQKLNPSGNLVWVKQIGGTTTDSGKCIIVDTFGNVYTTGIFNETADFDPGTGTYNLDPNQGRVFALKLRHLTVGAKDLITDLGVLVYPNPTSNVLEIDKGNNSEIKINIYDNTGKITVSKTSNGQVTKLDMHNFSAGIYYLIISDGVNSTTQKIVKH